jgi:hypothetical protein
MYHDTDRLSLVGKYLRLPLASCAAFFVAVACLL